MRARVFSRRLSRFAAVLSLLLIAVISGCSGSSTKNGSGPALRTPASGSAADGTDHGSIIARAGSSPVAADEIPACFIEGEPPVPAVAERTDVFQPPPRAATPLPAQQGTATPRPTPEVSGIATRASFPLYAFNAPGNELTPQLMRVTSVAGGAGRQVTLFALQYRTAFPRGGMLVVLSSPSPAAGLSPSDVDDAIDAIRLEARLPGTPGAGDPLADPGAALSAIGCPRREQVSVTLDGIDYPAVVVTWPGLPRVQVLHAETGRGELSIEAGVVDRTGLLALARRLVSLQRSPAVAGGLQSYFSAGILAGLSTPHSPTPTRSRTPLPGAGR